MDDIQRKLELIDRQLAGGRGIHKRLVTTCPLVFLAVGCAVGVVVQHTFDFSIRFWLILLGFFAALAVASYFVFRSRYFGKSVVRPEIPAYAALICFVCLGAIRLTSFQRPSANDIRNFVGAEQTLATIRGVTVSRPRLRQNRQWEFARFVHTDPQSSFYLKIDAVETAEGWMPVSGMVRVQVDEPVVDIEAGDYVRIYCTLHTFGEPSNPGQFNAKQYLARRNVFVGASVKLRQSIEVLENNSSGKFAKIKGKFRDMATQALSGDLSGDAAGEALLEALLLGYRGRIDHDTREAFRKTGLLHFISLSGLHLGILIMLIWWLCRTAGLMKKGRAIVCIIAIVVFLLIVPPRAPTVRAAIMGIVFCSSFLVRRYSRPINTLALAAIVTLLMRPTQLFEAGWQLSFASVLGILFFTNPIKAALHKNIIVPSRHRRNEDGWVTSRILVKSISPPLNLFAVGLAAWLGGAGILLYHFYRITPLAALWTVLVFPLVVPILTLGYLKMILSFLLPTLSALTGVLVTALADFLIWIVKLIAGLNISEILIGVVPLPLIVFYYSLVLFGAFTYFRRPLLKKLIVTTAISAIVIFLGITKWRRNHPSDLAVTCLAVGHGQAIVAQLPGGQNILFDAGSLFTNDVGGRIIAPFFDHCGIRDIDAIVISHSDVDHINGIIEVVKHCNVKAVYANETFISSVDKPKTAKFLKRRLRENGLEAAALNKLSPDSPATIKILWPNAEICRDTALGDNDKSIVSLIEFAGVKILLCSDIEQYAQRQILQRNPDLKAEIVVVPHHGSPITLDPHFLRALDARILIHSCSRGQYQRQQDSPYQTKAQRFYTPQSGAVTTRIDKHGDIKLKATVQN